MSESTNEITVVLATNNRDKVREIKPLLEHIAPEISVHSLVDLQVNIEIEEKEKLKVDSLDKAKPSILQIVCDTMYIVYIV